MERRYQSPIEIPCSVKGALIRGRSSGWNLQLTPAVQRRSVLRCLFMCLGGVEAHARLSRRLTVCNARNGGEPAFCDRCEVFEVECDKRTTQWSWMRKWVLTNVGWLLGSGWRTRRRERVEGQYGVKPLFLLAVPSEISFHYHDCGVSSGVRTPKEHTLQPQSLSFAGPKAVGRPADLEDPKFWTLASGWGTSTLLSSSPHSIHC